MRPHHALSTLLIALAAACCTDPAHEGAAPKNPPHAAEPAQGAPAPSPSAAPSAAATGKPGCHLPAPKISADACSTDADCAPSEPCHARECVAKAKAQPRPKDLMCTQILQCGTADANRCGCYQGHCALIPPGE